MFQKVRLRRAKEADLEGAKEPSGRASGGNGRLPRVSGEGKFGHNAAVLPNVPDRVRLGLACTIVVVTFDPETNCLHQENYLTLSRENVVCLLVQKAVLMFGDIDACNISVPQHACGHMEK